MINFKKFIHSEDGAVTVDWVVLTAAIIGMGLSVMILISSGTTDVSGSVGASLTSATPLEIEMPTF